MASVSQKLRKLPDIRPHATHNFLRGFCRFPPDLLGDALHLPLALRCHPVSHIRFLSEIVLHFLLYLLHLLQGKTLHRFPMRLHLIAPDELLHLIRQRPTVALKMLAKRLRRHLGVLGIRQLVTEFLVAKKVSGHRTAEGS